MLNLLYGIIAILFGIYMVWSTAKMKPMKKYYNSILFKGYGSGIGFIIIGIVLIAKQLWHWL